MNLTQLQKRIVANSENRDEWLTARNRGVTASNAANLVTEKSLSSVIKSKFYDGFMGNPATQHGLDREPILLQQVGFPQNTDLYRSEQNERFMATPDGIKFNSDGDLELCQVKTTSKHYTKMPTTHYRQVQWEMFVMGATRCLYVWEEHENFIPVDLEPASVWVDRDDEQINKLINLAEALLIRLDRANAFEEEL
ncbi:MAG: YqaJ viral recombinase family protein [Patescibacteria group bacterium]